jgi:type III pantothenate kinase
VKLLLDLGNSRCKFAIVEKDEVKQYEVQNYGPFGKLYSVKSLSDKYSDADEVVISSVLSEEMNSQIKEALLSGTVKKVFFLAPAENSFSVKLAYANPSSMGADRVAALIGAIEKYSGNCCIVDCGTAITIDALDAKGAHQGGVILPGIKTMQKALLGNTKIEASETETGPGSRPGSRPELAFNVLSKTTEDAIHTGCISAVAGGIEHVVNKMASEYDTFDQIVFTGGDAEYIKSFLDLKAVIDHTLVLDGLKVVSYNI